MADSDESSGGNADTLAIITTIFDYVPDVIDSRFANLLNQPEEFQIALKREISVLNQPKSNPKNANGHGKKNNKRNKQPTNIPREDDVSTKLLLPLVHLSCLFDSPVLKILFSPDESVPKIPIDTVDKNGRTALHHAALHHSSNSIRFLLSLRASPLSLSNSGLTPLEESIHSPKIKLEWGPETSPGHLVARLREQDLAAPKIIAESLPSKSLTSLAFKLARGTHVVPLLALLMVTQGALLDHVARGEDYLGAAAAAPGAAGEQGESASSSRPPLIANPPPALVPAPAEASGTLVDLLVGKILRYSERIFEGEGGNQEGAFQERLRRKRSTLLKLLEGILLFRPSLWSPREGSELNPVSRAAQAGDCLLLGVLIDNRADLGSGGSAGDTPLHWALGKPRQAYPPHVETDVVKMLLEAGCGALTGNRLGLTAVHVAAEYGHAGALKLLLAKEPAGANVMAKSRETPLHLAVKNNHVDCVEILLAHGANRLVESHSKERPGQLATTSAMRALLQEPEPQGHVHVGAAAAALEKPAVAGGVLYPPPPPPHPNAPSNMPAYRTIMCRNYSSAEGCGYGTKCHFAHNKDEQRYYTALANAGLNTSVAASTVAQAAPVHHHHHAKTQQQQQQQTKPKTEAAPRAPPPPSSQARAWGVGGTRVGAEVAARGAAEEEKRPTPKPAAAAAAAADPAPDSAVQEYNTRAGSAPAEVSQESVPATKSLGSNPGTETSPNSFLSHAGPDPALNSTQHSHNPSVNLAPIMASDALAPSSSGQPAASSAVPGDLPNVGVLQKESLLAAASVFSSMQTHVDMSEQSQQHALPPDFTHLPALSMQQQQQQQAVPVPRDQSSLFSLPPRDPLPPTAAWNAGLPSSLTEHNFFPPNFASRASSSNYAATRYLESMDLRGPRDLPRGFAPDSRDYSLGREMPSARDWAGSRGLNSMDLFGYQESSRLGYPELEQLGESASYLPSKMQWPQQPQKLGDPLNTPAATWNLPRGPAAGGMGYLGRQQGALEEQLMRMELRPSKPFWNDLAPAPLPAFSPAQHSSHAGFGSASASGDSLWSSGVHPDRNHR